MGLKASVANALMSHLVACLILHAWRPHRNITAAVELSRDGQRFASSGNSVIFVLRADLVNIISFRRKSSVGVGGLWRGDCNKAHPISVNNILLDAMWP
ncbi:hypothetical protein CFBP1573P_05371 [Pseudomonas syringae pv. persicae]|uniref:Secreted protein n=1 Tax=Pseudomonas syringae pv. persicae TaxID=237306 RepID=A0AB38EM88_9PSED|nr:hypothetical protein CFBP1573P_05371 [Pseudomonas syringae pv. persicae]SOQ15218.1 hypothetical protein NCPPB2254_05347 [Pseudomonas syringae pv. persicae]